jgi:DNA polymerase-3 subunit beta
MKFIINRELLLTPLQQIVNVIEKRQTMPILANVLFQLEKNQLTLTQRGKFRAMKIIALIQLII